MTDLNSAPAGKEHRSPIEVDELHKLVMQSLDDDQAVEVDLDPAGREIVASPTIW